MNIFLKESIIMYSPHLVSPELDGSDSDFSGIIEPILLKIPDTLAGTRLDAALATIIPELSRSRLTNWLKAGHVLINKQVLKPKDKVLGGEEVEITPPLSEETLAFTPENIPLNVIYADEHIIILNKPAGLTVHPGNGNWNGTLLNALLYHYPELSSIPRAGIVHRLDKDTTGLMVVARTLLAQTKLVQQLQARSVSRIYRAIVEGSPPVAGIINKNIGRDLRNRTKMATLELGGKEAITHYRVLQYFNDFSYIECKLETGRTHQIRVHLKSLGYPIVGDPVYGSKKINYPQQIVTAIKSLNRQALHALKLSLIHPATNEELHFAVPLAEDMKDLIGELNFDLQDSYVLDEENFVANEGWEIIYVK
jgi:23S rRNA pseudouridine1911/1915/1917 synthase